MKIFISGPMSGYEDFNRPAFMEAEKFLKEHGFDVFNPAWMNVGEEWTRGELLAIDICALSKCDAIYQLPGWFTSSGAKLEWDYARKAGIKSLFTIKILPREDGMLYEPESFDGQNWIAPNVDVFMEADQNCRYYSYPIHILDEPKPIDNIRFAVGEVSI